MRCEPNAATAPVECRECSIAAGTICGLSLAGSPDAISTLRREVRTLGPQRTILQENERPKMIYMLHSGWAFQYSQLPDGRRQIFSFLIPGDAVNLETLFFPQMPFLHSAKSLTPVALCVFPVEPLAELMRTSKPQQAAASENFRRYLSSITNRITDIGRRSALARLANLLIEIEERLKRRELSKDGAFEFPILQEHMADALGLTTVYVNRTLDQLRKQGIIAFRRHAMTILDFDRLHEIASDE